MTKEQFLKKYDLTEDQFSGKCEISGYLDLEASTLESGEMQNQYSKPLDVLCNDLLEETKTLKAHINRLEKIIESAEKMTEAHVKDSFK